MDRLVAATFVITTLAGALPVQAAGPAEVVHEWALAHEDGSADRAAQLYTPNARVWSLAAPREWVGHDDIGHYLVVFALGAARPDFRIESYSLMPVGEQVVVASGHCAVVREQWDGSAAREDCRFSLTLVRGGDGAWRIAEQHSSALPR